jgi:rhamnopyranosyl-N-acetylglucosaminyl-diphospho-decaprenol beta-1,3/1,4-galactofuranosyltransferase
MRVLAAVVTHNRSSLLVRCIDGIQAQTRPPDCLLIVNNASTDNTLPMLVKRGIRTITQENTGAAGGWFTCFEVALKEEFDVVWVMDDDGYPDRVALANLLEAFERRVACISSIVVREDDPRSFVFPFPILNKDQLPVIFGVPRRVLKVDRLRKLCCQDFYPFAHLFNGALISVPSVRKIGNVNKDFFIYGEEVDFFYRLRKVGEVKSLITAMHFHPDVSSRKYTVIKVYFYIKNSLIINKMHKKNFYIHHFLSVGIIFKRIIHVNGWKFFFELLLGTNRRVLFSALVRGLSMRIGNDYDFHNK